VSHVIIGTAGHVDHGKTALIKALTGKETDRLQEEIDRGISIELGFAPFKLPSGRQAGVVDVPGHERFIHNMLAGIGGIDLVLLVVDVTEGVMPQTREHVEIMDLLQISRGIVVLAKVDLAEDEDWLDLVEEEVHEALTGTFLADAPYFRVSAHTGRGLKELVSAIDEMTATMTPRDHRAPLRLPVDRVFTITGFGTIVTGTLLVGSIKQGITVEVLPSGRSARVRQVQVHGKLVDEALAGQRAAVNLSGLEKEALPRGSVVVSPGTLAATYMLDATLKLLPSAPKKMKNLTRVHVYLGTGRSVGRVALLDRDELNPGEEAPVQLRLEKKLVGSRGDRYIIRSFSPMTTIGGGLILEADSSKHKRFKQDVLERLKELEKGDPAAPILQRIRREGALSKGALAKQAGMAPEVLESNLLRLSQEEKIINANGLWVDTVMAREWKDLLESTLETYHLHNHLAVGMSRAELKSILPKEVTQKVYDWLLSKLTEEGQLTEAGDMVSLASHSPQPNETEMRQIEQLTLLYLEGGFIPPTLKDAALKIGLSPEQTDILLSYLNWKKTLVRLDHQLFLHHEYFQKAKEELCGHFRQNKTLAAGEFREKLGTTRKFAVPLLETFDRLKWTRRNGDERVVWRLDLEDCEGGKNDGA
jgi:selenocysteine-specific elongation factor